MKKRLIWILALFLLVSNVYGLGMAPARSRYEFQANSVEQGRFRIIVDDVPSQVTLQTEDELGKYIGLEKTVLVLNEYETWVDFTLNLPEELPPGERKGSILVSQQPLNQDKADVVYAVPAVKHQIFVNSPYPGKYLTGKLFISTAKSNEPIAFTIALANWGKESIEEAKAAVIVKGPTNEELAVLHTDSIGVVQGEETKLTAFWQTEYSGTYFAEVVVEYDGKIIELSQAFTVGSLEIEIERIQVNNFKIGQIAKLDIYLRNKWNQPLKVDGRVEIFKQNKLISTFNTVPVDIGEKSAAVMEAYWNTQGIEVGEYDIAVKAMYDGKTSEKTFSSIVSIDGISFKDMVSAQVVSSGNNNTTILVIAVFVLIILNVFLFFYINKRLRKRVN